MSAASRRYSARGMQVQEDEAAYIKHATPNQTWIWRRLRVGTTVHFAGISFRRRPSPHLKESTKLRRDSRLTDDNALRTHQVFVLLGDAVQWVHSLSSVVCDVSWHHSSFNQRRLAEDSDRDAGLLNMTVETRC
ncbi:hypothetical protein HRR90_003105 [Exophiala dermatitidis]|nr:hypothetical protein HRR82_003214 [Exophiala dermatitidis]KAJ4623813.1 hypothetical protein HRR85_000669 [Exophiala dermatitidis]KAJ4656195.1 hypothetical protein HRR90_003105 [Exophiala dermatitidis]KAJ4699115.1 hypothetical protein HRR87_000664 [Exophiala dermatitidis]